MQLMPKQQYKNNSHSSSINHGLIGHAYTLGAFFTTKGCLSRDWLLRR